MSRLALQVIALMTPDEQEDLGVWAQSGGGAAYHRCLRVAAQVAHAALVALLPRALAEARGAALLRGATDLDPVRLLTEWPGRHWVTPAEIHAAAATACPICGKGPREDRHAGTCSTRCAEDAAHLACMTPYVPEVSP